MLSSRADGAVKRAPCVARLLNFVFAALLLLLMAPTAGAADNALSEADNTCLGCHSEASLAKELPGGKTLSLHIKAETFAKSVHAPLGCAACHADLELETHSQGTKTIKAPREYSIGMAQVCSGCHDDASRQNEKSVHAALLGAGKSSAPTCTDCHGSHSVSPKTAYETCVTCHASAPGLHAKWLPNAALHLEVVSCAACHAPKAARMVDLRLYDSAAQKWIMEKEGQPRFESLARSIDKDGNGLDAMELRTLLAQINRDPTTASGALRGRIELRSAVEAHQLSEKANAIRECASCHSDGAEPFQSVTISITGPDGRPIRYRAQKEVLNSVLSTDSLRLFYAIGGTRNTVLDILLMLAVLGGISVPIAHQLMKRIVNRQHGDSSSEDAPGGSDRGDTPK